MITHGKDIKIFAANSNPKLAADIAAILGLSVGQAIVNKFSDGEISVNIYETVRGSDVFVVQSTCDPINDNLMELLIMTDAFKRASAGRITAVIPYFGYARQDRKSKARDPISAKLVADLITAAGANRVLTMDLHATQIQGFFNIPVDHLLGSAILCPYFSETITDLSDTVMVSPDLGSVTRARYYAEKLELPLAIIDKRRPKANVSEVMNIIGDIKNKNVVMIDDLIDTAGTIVHAANALKERGAKKITVGCSHPVFSGPAIQRIQESPIEEMVVLDTIPLKPEKKLDKITVLSSSTVFAEAIDRIYEDLSVSTLFI
jgi:ribose-phosphate pyrophosphokinase